MPCLQAVVRPFIFKNRQKLLILQVKRKAIALSCHTIVHIFPVHQSATHAIVENTREVVGVARSPKRTTPCKRDIGGGIFQAQVMLLCEPLTSKMAEMRNKLVRFRVENLSKSSPSIDNHFYK